MQQIETAIRHLRALHPARRGPHGRESGVAIVEFALVAPLLFLAMFMVFEFARALNYWIDGTHLASEGARLAAVNKNPDAGSGSLQAYIKGRADTPELRNGGASVAPPGLEVCITPGAKIGDPVTVEVKAKYKWLPILGAQVADTMITGRATMRMERPATEYSAGCES